MRIWVLRTKAKQVGYDEYDGHVVAADDEHEARALCPWGDEGSIWIDPELTLCEEVCCAVIRAGVILSSFNAG